MAKASERKVKTPDAYLIIDFVLDPSSRQELTSILNERTSLIHELEAILSEFLLWREVERHDVQPAHSVETLEKIAGSARLLEKELSALHVRPASMLWQLMGKAIHNTFLEELPGRLEELRTLAESADTAHKHFQKYIQMGRPNQLSRQWLAEKIGELLHGEGFKITTTKRGPYYQCLKTCLRATGDIPPDTVTYKADIGKLVGPVVKEIAQRSSLST